MSILGRAAMRLVGWEPHFSAECSIVRSDVAELYFLKWKAQSNAMQGQMWFCCWWEGGGTGRVGDGRVGEVDPAPQSLRSELPIFNSSYFSSCRATIFSSVLSSPSQRVCSISLSTFFSSLTTRCLFYFVL